MRHIERDKEKIISLKAYGHLTEMELSNGISELYYDWCVKIPVFEKMIKDQITGKSVKTSGSRAQTVCIPDVFVPFNHWVPGKNVLTTGQS